VLWTTVGLLFGTLAERRFVERLGGRPFARPAIR
jgi:hypothetical protein